VPYNGEVGSAVNLWFQIGLVWMLSCNWDKFMTYASTMEELNVPAVSALRRAIAEVKQSW
jgi:hypothetical protein